MIRHSIAKPLVFWLHNLRSLIAGCALTIASCSGDTSTGELHGNGMLSMAVPEPIRRVLAVDIDKILATANINGVAYPMRLIDNRFIGNISLTRTETITISLRFEECLDASGLNISLENGEKCQESAGIPITLAEAQERQIQTNNQNETVRFVAEDFNTDCNQCDFDGDNLSNLQEREIGTNPIIADVYQESRNVTLTFSIPNEIPFPAVTQPRVLMDLRPRGVELLDEFTYTSRGTVNTPNPVLVEVDLLQRLTPPQTVLLARFSEEVPVGFNDVSIQPSHSEFDYSFDNDGDGRSNIEEIRNGTNPVLQD